MSHATVKTRVAGLLAKLGVRDRFQLVIIASGTGLVSPARWPAFRFPLPTVINAPVLRQGSRCRSLRAVVYKTGWSQEYLCRSVVEWGESEGE